MKVRYIYSACIEIETPDIRILTDPWFTPGAYDGAWHQFPELKDPLSVIKEPDVIYISHIHPDHYDPIFIKKLFERYGEKPVLIPNFEKNYLYHKAKADGISVTEVNEIKYGDTNIHIIPNVHGSDSDIDSALFVNYKDKNLLNLNDCIESPKHVYELKTIINQYCDKLDLLALGYTGAGPFPQTYYALSDPELPIKAELKKQQFFKRYISYTEHFDSTYHLPFAGKYLLAGKLTELNDFRGVADAFEVKLFDSKAIILADHGNGEIDLASGHISAQREQLYSHQDYEARKAELKDKKLDYENEIYVPIEKIKFRKLLFESLVKARSKSELEEDYFFVFHIQNNDKKVLSLALNCNKYSNVELFEQYEGLEPRSEYYVDYRHFFGCLTGLYHWNNAEVASFINVRRVPNIHNGRAQAFLNFLSVA
ncbi:MBL fold metallo-hydrolase [Pseudoalteromonas gelatinilytica]|uniref:MBL fold metallo-hydrolase n=1 Tax=Pseudoalteromonas gelatinilytica TaxID=1703256 RepID=A0A3A3EI10_9GAMM|nr:MBL fold metallo-hydrolase [Pseudoalteromonas profundi]RJF34600.1 MBL fold metallo-hydrolase [Pseudoalteromonas profundi]